MSSKKMPVTHMGTSLILVILVILALAVFAVLSLVQTNRDKLLGEQIALQNQRYYEACGQAEDMLARIDAALVEAYTPNQESYYASAADALSKIEGLTLDSSQDTLTVSFSVSFPQERELFVALEAKMPQDKEDGFYRILSWEERSTRPWESDNSLELAD